MRFKHFILSVMMGFVLMIPIQVKASDVANIKDPVFDGVERVYIIFDGHFMRLLDETKIPESLKPENVEKNIVEAYTRRFSSEECVSFFKDFLKTGTNPYGCTDPVVKVFYDHRPFSKQFFNMYDPLTRDPGTLVVSVTMRATDNKKITSVPLVSLFTLIYRPDQDSSFSAKQDLRMMPINISEEMVQLSIKAHLMRMMR